MDKHCLNNDEIKEIKYKILCLIEKGQVISEELINKYNDLIRFNNCR